MKRFLIHGYGKSLDISESEIPANGGFYIFDAELSSGDARAFLWAVPWSRKWLAPWNPWAQLQLYRAERKEIQKDALLERLGQELREFQPDQVICHSMGAQLLVNYVERYGLPESVRSVVFVQADVARTEVLPVIPHVSWSNYWCWWDSALWISAVLNLRFPCGLLGSDDKMVTNHFFGLSKGPNLHQDVWRDERLYQQLES